jgi:hypothetical protein
MRVKDFLEHLDGAGLTITDWDQMSPALAEAGLTLETNLNEAQWTDCETVQERAVRILTDAGIPADLYHTGGGIMVAEARSSTISNRYVWVTASEAAASGPFLLIAYRDREGETGIECLSGACTEQQLPDRARRALAEPA